MPLKRGSVDVDVSVDKSLADAGLRYVTLITFRRSFSRGCFYSSLFADVGLEFGF